MRSHRYFFSTRDCIRAMSAPVVGLAVLAVALHAAHWLKLLPAAKPIDNPDETLLTFKTQLSRSRHPARVILLGDSSCAIGIDAPGLRALLPQQPVVLNLGLFIGFGLDVYGEALSDYVEHNPDQVQWVVLLVTPQFLTDESRVPSAYPSWRRLHQPEQESGTWEGHGWANLLGSSLLKDHLLRRVLHTPLKGSALYGFSSGFAEYMAGHEGSMVEPAVFHPPAHPVHHRYYLAPALEQASRQFRRRLPPGVKLAIGITPLPDSLCDVEFMRQRNDLLARWNSWIDADYCLINGPIKLPDALFASGAHLNPAGQQRYTHQVGALLRPVLQSKLVEKLVVQRLPVTAARETQ
jgi:hypothetical protein